MPSPFYPASVVLFQLHGGMVSYMQILATPWERGFLRYMPSPFYPASVVLFQLHGGMVSYMQILATPWERGFLRYMPSPFYPASVVLFHGGMVSYMQILATPSSTVNNTKYLDPYHRNHINFSYLFLRQ